jgi:uncharacterized protein (DUF2225 family)
MNNENLRKASNLLIGAASELKKAAKVEKGSAEYELAMLHYKSLTDEANSLVYTYYSRTSI